MSMMESGRPLLGGPPEGGPGEIPVPPPGGGRVRRGSRSIDFLDAAEDALNQFIQVDPDEVDRAKAAQALKIVLDLKAANQTDAEQGGMKSLQRAISAGGGPMGAGAGPPPGGPVGY